MPAFWSDQKIGTGTECDVKIDSIKMAKKSEFSSLCFGLSLIDTLDVLNLCTNFTPTKRAEWVKASLCVDLPLGFPDESYPGFDAPIAIKSHRSGRVACGSAKFGLIPPWAKDDKISRHTYNARSETAAEKPSYRGAWRQRQFALVLVDDFYEPSYETGKAVRWRIQLTSGEPFAIASLWDRWTNPATGEQVVSFSMLTVNADQHPVMRQFHKPGDEKRTPVIIRPEFSVTGWLPIRPVRLNGCLGRTCPNCWLRPHQEPRQLEFQTQSMVVVFAAT